MKVGQKAAMYKHQRDELVRLILDDMGAATNQDLAADGDVPQGEDSAEGRVWARIETKARSIRMMERR